MIAEEVLAPALLFGFGLVVAWLFAEIDRGSRTLRPSSGRSSAGPGPTPSWSRSVSLSAWRKDLHDGIDHQPAVRRR